MDDEYVINVTLPGTPERFTRDCRGPVRIGRAPEADIQLAHPLVSRYHAEVALQTDGDFLVKDLGSRNGTIVNDEVLLQASRFVSAGATIQVGPYMLQLVPAGFAFEETIVAGRAEQRLRVTLDRGLHLLQVDGRPAVDALTGLEYRLMDVLTGAAGQLVPSQEIGDRLWGAGGWDPYMLHNLVRRVRRKLEERGFAGDELIVSVPGGGYHIV